MVVKKPTKCNGSRFQRPGMNPSNSVQTICLASFLLAVAEELLRREEINANTHAAPSSLTLVRLHKLGARSNFFRSLPLFWASLVQLHPHDACCPLNILPFPNPHHPLFSSSLPTRSSRSLIYICLVRPVIRFNNIFIYFSYSIDPSATIFGSLYKKLLCLLPANSTYQDVR
jgi:hypothetical protein